MQQCPSPRVHLDYHTQPKHIVIVALRRTSYRDRKSISRPLQMPNGGVYDSSPVLWTPMVRSNAIEPRLIVVKQKYKLGLGYCERKGKRKTKIRPKQPLWGMFKPPGKSFDRLLRWLSLTAVDRDPGKTSRCASVPRQPRKVLNILLGWSPC